MFAATRDEQIPAAPFQLFVDELLAGPFPDAASVAHAFGWDDGESAMRRLNRLRSATREIARGTGAARITYHTRSQTIPRHTVEDALHFMGGPPLVRRVFEEYYGKHLAGRRANGRDVAWVLKNWWAIIEWIAEQDAPAVPETWCPNCQEHVLVVAGDCAWCGWKNLDPASRVAA